MPGKTAVDGPTNERLTGRPSSQLQATVLDRRSRLVQTEIKTHLVRLVCV